MQRFIVHQFHHNCATSAVGRWAGRRVNILINVWHTHHRTSKKMLRSGEKSCSRKGSIDAGGDKKLMLPLSLTYTPTQMYARKQTVICHPHPTEWQQSALVPFKLKWQMNLTTPRRPRFARHCKSDSLHWTPFDHLAPGCPTTPLWRTGSEDSAPDVAVVSLQTLFHYLAPVGAARVFSQENFLLKNTVSEWGFRAVSWGQLPPRRV